MNLNKKSEKIYSWLGLAQRAGQLVSGEDTVYRLIGKKKLSLLVVATDCSDNTRKLAEKWAAIDHIPLLPIGTRDTLGQAIGKQWRAVIGVKDLGFALKLQQLVNEQDEY